LDTDAWLTQCAEWRREFPLKYPKRGKSLRAQHVLDRLNDLTEGRALVTTDVGQHQMWAAQFVRTRENRTWLSSGGAGTMGYGFPAAIGAQFARPEAQVWAIVGDGGFQMTMCELATAAIHKLPVKVLIINNNYLGMVRQWQELFFAERYSGVYLDPDVPDYVKLAEAYGAVGLRADDPGEVDAVIEKAFSVEDRSVVIDFRVDPREMVFPMVPAGASNDDIILDPEGATPTRDPAEAPIV
jgi:acetolactate synthase-1/2/3 large subunit